MQSKIMRLVAGLVLVVAGVVSVEAAAPAPAAPAAKAPAAAAAEGQAPPVVAKVGDWQLTIREVNQFLVSQLYELNLQAYKLQMQVVQDRLAEQMLSLEAKEQKTTLDELLKREVEAKTPKVTDEELAKFMEANKARFPNGGEGMQDKVRAFMQEKAFEKARDEYLVLLMKKFKAQILFPPPMAPRFKVPGPDDLVKGKSGAPVTIHEFSDFQCPYCSRALPVLKEVEKAYPDQVRIVYRHYPLPNHDKAPKAGEAAQCAADQGKFWEMHDLLFASQDKLEVADLKKKAEQLKLDAAKFNKCLDGGQHAKRVAQDRDIGDQLGISGTPTFLVNGLKLVGAVPIEQFKKVIDEELRIHQQRQQAPAPAQPAPAAPAASGAKKK